MRNPLHHPPAIATLAVLSMFAVGCLTVAGVMAYRHGVDAKAHVALAIETR